MECVLVGVGVQREKTWWGGGEEGYGVNTSKGGGIWSRYF